MRGWIVPSPKQPTKSRSELERERIAKVQSLLEQGYVKSERMEKALLKVRREDFIPEMYRDYAYLEVPLPLPGTQATLSCPHSYPLFYEPLGLTPGHQFLEIGTGSGYGAAVAREIVGRKGQVVSVEIDPLTFEFAQQNLEAAGYTDVVLVQGDGGFGYPDLSPYDSISITAACFEAPAPLLAQLKVGGRLITPMYKQGGAAQDLVLFQREADGVRREALVEVLYVPLRGEYGS